MDPYARFVYASNFGNKTIAQYSLGAFGSMTFNGTVGVGNSPDGLTVDPSGRFLFVVAPTAVYGYTINQNTGLLTAISGGAALATVTNAIAITVDPTGRFLFVGSNGPNQVSAFSINPATGTLTTITGSPFSTATAYQLAVDPTGKFLYSAGTNGSGSGLILLCPIAAATGAISCSVTQNLATTTGIAMEPYGQYFYATVITGNVIAFSIAPSTGSLSAVGSQPATGTSPNSIAVDLLGQYVYVTNNGSNTISAYKIDLGTGALTEITGVGSPFAAGTSPGSVVIGGVIQ
jgi:6-phosphogluconolactonase (cycloisomerase 2 family)